MHNLEEGEQSWFILSELRAKANDAIILDYGYAALAIWKAVVVAGFYALYRASPRSIRVGVPVGLVFLGGFITACNT